jgi:hypothetical protein
VGLTWIGCVANLISICEFFHHRFRLQKDTTNRAATAATPGYLVGLFQQVPSSFYLSALCFFRQMTRVCLFHFTVDLVQNQGFPHIFEIVALV